MAQIILKILTVILCAFFYTSYVHAGEFEKLIYNSVSGQLITKTSFTPELNNLQILTPKLPKVCSEDLSKHCIPYRLYAGGNAVVMDNLRNVVDKAFNLWRFGIANPSVSAVPKLSFFAYDRGNDSDGSIPYRWVSAPGGEIVKDSFGAEIIEGDFLISVQPPADITFEDGEVIALRRYLVPDLGNGETQIMWGGIFINPAFFQDFGCSTICFSNSGISLTTVLVHAIGRLMGIESSAMRNSVMFPSIRKDSAKDPTVITEDDRITAEVLYAVQSNLNLGKISGVVLSGVNGNPMPGAHVMVIPEAKKEEFIKTRSLSLAKQGVFTDKDGKFIFRNLAPGGYFLMVEPTRKVASLASFGEWMSIYGSSDIFEIEFYDGKGRESNQEPIYSFSPQAISFAATLLVSNSSEVQGVKVITNIPSRQVGSDTVAPLQNAEGATAETLSTQVMSDISQTLLESFDQNQNIVHNTSRTAGGCSLMPHTSKGGYSFLNIVWTLCLLCLAILVRKKSKSSVSRSV